MTAPSRATAHEHGCGMLVLLFMTGYRGNAVAAPVPRRDRRYHNPQASRKRESGHAAITPEEGAARPLLPDPARAGRRAAERARHRGDPGGTHRGRRDARR